MENTAKIYVAGHRGLIGSAIERRLRVHGFNNLIYADHAALELTDEAQVNRFFDEHRPEYVVLAAGRVGGIVENQSFPADFIHINLAIQLNLLRVAHHYGVRKLILFASSCMYPRECPQPMAEDALLTGRPEPSSLAYAISKLAGMQMCLAYNQQYGVQRFIPVIPNSAFGPNDNFDPHSGHVLSSLIRRFHEAKSSGAADVVLWGSGAPRREFVHADDIAEACIRLLTLDTTTLPLPVNIGTGTDYSIQQLAVLIARVIGFEGQIVWDHSKPDGAPCKLLDSSRMRTFGWNPSVDFEQGVKQTYQWYLYHVLQTEKSS